jgi:hypothetical protein
VSCTSSHLNFVDETLKSSKNCKEIPQQKETDLKRIKLKRRYEYTNMKTLVLDLD